MAQKPNILLADAAVVRISERANDGVVSRLRSIAATLLAAHGPEWLQRKAGVAPALAAQRPNKYATEATRDACPTTMAAPLRNTSFVNLTQDENKTPGTVQQHKNK